MIEEKNLEKARKKFRTNFAYDNEVRMNLRKHIAVNPSHTIAIATPYLKELSRGLKGGDKLEKLPIFRSKKTHVLLNLGNLFEQISLLYTMGIDEVMLKLPVEGDMPLEIVALDPYWEDPPKKPTRILVAPMITTEEKMLKWIKKECRQIRERKKKNDNQ